MDHATAATTRPPTTRLLARLVSLDATIAPRQAACDTFIRRPADRLLT